MPGPARVAAHHALRLIETSALGDALARVRDPLADPRDRALVTDLVIGTLRWRGAIDHQLERMSGRGLATLDADVLTALRLGAYQLIYLERIPASAVVNDSVEIVKSARHRGAASLVNAVLRRMARERGALTWPSRQALLDHLAVTHSHPKWLVSRWIERYGVAGAETRLAFNNQMPHVTVAANRLRNDRELLKQALSRESVSTVPTRVAPHGLTVTEGKLLATDAFKSGACLVQDEASQTIPELVAARSGEAVLDACAAPGGKTVALAGQVADRALLVATDVRMRRVRLLASTLRRCGVASARVVQVGKSGPLPFAESSFDRLLVDAPCSGLGTVRRDPDIKWKRSPADLPGFAAIQTDLLQRLSRLLRPGGRLVYSTCSSEPEENEEVVGSFLTSARDFVRRPLSTLVEVPATIRALGDDTGVLQTSPQLHGLEAFFGAVLERQG